MLSQTMKFALFLPIKYFKSFLGSFHFEHCCISAIQNNNGKDDKT